MRMDAIAIARALAAAHPAARLPCPHCAASLNAENVDRHLAKVHGGASASATAAWRGRAFFGLLPGEIVLDGDAFVLRRLGLWRRAVRLPCAIEMGVLTRKQSNAIMASYADDMNVSATTVRAGFYLRLVGDSSVTIGCRNGTQFKSHWDPAGFRAGERRTRCDLLIDREAFVGIEYALAGRGLLLPLAGDPDTATVAVRGREQGLKARGRAR